MPQLQLLSLILLFIYLKPMFSIIFIYFLSEELNAPSVVLSKLLFVAEGNRVLNDYAINNESMDKK